jgi:hypothetical protein
MTVFDVLIPALYLSISINVLLDVVLKLASKNHSEYAVAALVGWGRVAKFVCVALVIVNIVALLHFRELYILSENWFLN